LTKTKTSKIEGFPIAEGDPLAEEHLAVSAWVEEAITALSATANGLIQDLDLKTFPSGQALLDGKAERSRRLVLAAVAQIRHWAELTRRLREETAGSIRAGREQEALGWQEAWGRRRQAWAVVNALMRRTLPFARADLLALLRWCSEGDGVLTPHQHPIGPITRALERFQAETPVDPELLDEARRFAARLRASFDKEAKRLGSLVEQLCGSVEGPDAEAEPPGPTRPAPEPESAGDPRVLAQLKRFLGLRPDPDPDNPATTIVGLDRFPMLEDSPLRREHEALGALFEEVINAREYWKFTLSEHQAGRDLLANDLATAGRVVLAAAERHVNALIGSLDDNVNERPTEARHASARVTTPLLQAGFEVDRDGLFDLLLYLSVRPTNPFGSPPFTLGKLVEQAEAEAEAERSPLTEGERHALWLFRASLASGPAFGAPSEPIRRLTRLIEDGANFFLASGEAWSDAANADLTRLEPDRAKRWAALLKHAMGATSTRPSAKWIGEGGKLVASIGPGDVKQALLRWFPLVNRGLTLRRLGQHDGDTRSGGDVMIEENATILRGLLWLAPTLPDPDDLTRTITSVAISAYKKVPGIGPRAVKVGNAAVYALSEIPSTAAVGQLALLKVRIKFGSAQKEIEKAFGKAAEALGLPRDQIEEMGVPSYGLEDVGHRSETFGEHRAEVVVSGSDAELRWFDGKGKNLKSVPARVKAEHKDDLKEIQQSLKDIQAMLPAQRDRLDAMFLLQKSWPIADWRERYLDHPLVGTIARRLIWRVDGVPALFFEGEGTDLGGHPVLPNPSSRITFWHPVECPVDEITAWRGRLEALGVTQPFKQAHREVYPLTDAERNTRTYSNRFAAHILRQHQFNALCAARGWKNKLRLMVDDTFPPATKDLPQWGLRAEFWVEGIGDDYGTDTNESGVYLRLATDQVRFYRTGAAENQAQAGGGGYTTAAAGPGRGQLNEPLPLEEIPPLVLSEVLRDVDLFVGVGSVGNDPTWQDGGPQGRYQTYWQSYSFGELSGTAATRKQVLERLVPRLKIADRCSFSDRFLVVRGGKRTYKIHLGSGNILMEPNDQYLCIVPDSRDRAAQGDLFLPFEGDNMLSIILSKALLLADDTKIKDTTILSQITRR